jgi:hypothetical protein
MNRILFAALSLCGALGLLAPLSQQTLAQATQQLRKANEGEVQRGQVYDGRRDQGTVRANPAPRPSPVGQQIRSTAGNPGYQPASPRLRITEPPSPTSSTKKK